MLSLFSHIRLFATLWIIAYRALLSVGFSKQEYWSGLPCPSPGDLPHPGIQPVSLVSPALAGRFFTTSPVCGLSACHSQPSRNIRVELLFFFSLVLLLLSELVESKIIPMCAYVFSVQHLLFSSTPPPPDPAVPAPSNPFLKIFPVEIKCFLGFASTDSLWSELALVFAD